MKRQYITEFTDTILEKKQKANKLFEIIEYPTIQDKLSLKIVYKNFLNNKSDIYDLIQRGYKISILLDEEFILDDNELKKLEVFKFILVSRNHKYYEAIKDSEVGRKVIELP